MAEVHDLSTGKVVDLGESSLTLVDRIRMLSAAATARQTRPPPTENSLMIVSRNLFYSGTLINAETPVIVLNVISRDQLNPLDFANVRIGFIAQHKDMGIYMGTMWVEDWCLEPFVRAEEK